MFAPNLAVKTSCFPLPTQIARASFATDLAVATLVFHGVLSMASMSCHVIPRKIPPFRYTSYKSRPLIAKNQTEWCLVFSVFQKKSDRKEMLVAVGLWLKARCSLSSSPLHFLGAKELRKCRRSLPNICQKMPPVEVLNEKFLCQSRPQLPS